MLRLRLHLQLRLQLRVHEQVAFAELPRLLLAGVELEIETAVLEMLRLEQRLVVVVLGTERLWVDLSLEWRLNWMLGLRLLMMLMLLVLVLGGLGLRLDGHLHLGLLRRLEGLRGLLLLLRCFRVEWLLLLRLRLRWRVRGWKLLLGLRRSPCLCWSWS